MESRKFLMSGDETTDSKKCDIQIRSSATMIQPSTRNMAHLQFNSGAVYQNIESTNF